MLYKRQRIKEGNKDSFLRLALLYQMLKTIKTNSTGVALAGKLRRCLFRAVLIGVEPTS